MVTLHQYQQLEWADTLASLHSHSNAFYVCDVLSRKRCLCHPRRIALRGL
jgi:hypothetical protein